MGIPVPVHSIRVSVAALQTTKHSIWSWSRAICVTIWRIFPVLSDVLCPRSHSFVGAHAFICFYIYKLEARLEHFADEAKRMKPAEKHQKNTTVRGTAYSGNFVCTLWNLKNVCHLHDGVICTRLLLFPRTIRLLQSFWNAIRQSLFCVALCYLINLAPELQDTVCMKHNCLQHYNW